MENMEEIIENQNWRQKVIKEKTVFIARKNEVYYSLCDDSTEYTAIQESVERMLAAQDTTFTGMSELSGVYD